MTPGQGHHLSPSNMIGFDVSQPSGVEMESGISEWNQEFLLAAICISLPKAGSHFLWGTVALGVTEELRA